MEKGDTVELSDDIARRLLKDAKGSVRVVPNRWQWAWSETALISNGLTVDDPRFEAVCHIVSQLDSCYLANDFEGFWREFSTFHILLTPGRKGHEN